MQSAALCRGRRQSALVIRLARCQPRSWGVLTLAPAGSRETQTPAPARGHSLTFLLSLQLPRSQARGAPHVSWSCLGWEPCLAVSQLLSRLILERNPFRCASVSPLVNWAGGCFCRGRSLQIKPYLQSTQTALHARRGIQSGSILTTSAAGKGAFDPQSQPRGTPGESPPAGCITGPRTHSTSSHGVQASTAISKLPGDA